MIVMFQTEGLLNMYNFFWVTSGEEFYVCACVYYI